MMEPTKCPRCLSGIDDDHDGNCANCARLTDQQARAVADVIKKSLKVDQLFEERNNK